MKSTYLFCIRLYVYKTSARVYNRAFYFYVLIIYYIYLYLVYSFLISSSYSSSCSSRAHSFYNWSTPLTLAVFVLRLAHSRTSKSYPARNIHSLSAKWQLRELHEWRKFQLNLKGWTFAWVLHSMVDVKSLLHDIARLHVYPFMWMRMRMRMRGEKKMRNILKVIKNVIYIRS